MRDSLFQKAAKNVKTFGFLVLTFLVSGILVSAQTIYDNGPFATGATSRSGVAAPAGAQWSEVQSDAGNTTESNTSAGSATAAGTFRLADDFNVPVGQTWTINSVDTFAYLTGGGAATPFTSGVLQIWRGRPGDAGSMVIFGDTTTNRLGTSTDTNTFRVFNTVTPAPGTVPGTTRRIWRNTLTVAPALVLTAGTYWVEWATVVNNVATTAHFAPSATITGARDVPRNNARQLTTATNVWVNALDTGNPAAAPDLIQDFPFKLNGTATGSASVPRSSKSVDFDGDNRSDFAIARAMSAGTQTSWWVNNTSGISARQWGNGVGFATGDRATPADFDGDGKTDIAVWRPGTAGTAAFYILQSQSGTVRAEAFGQTGDDPSVVADYNNDGRADLATYRPGAQGVFYYRTAANGAVTFIPWGTTGDIPVTGDYNGDGSADPTVVRNQTGQAVFYHRLSGTPTGTLQVNFFGLPTDKFAPGDYDRDGRTDICAVRSEAGTLRWYVWQSSNNSVLQVDYGTAATDIIAQGDYDGDGRTDFGVWRSGSAAAQFFVRNSSSAPSLTGFGTSSVALAAPDYPVANFNVK